MRYYADAHLAHTMLNSLRTYQFRNLSEQTVQLDPGINILVGNNGQGKTNLLEAIFLLHSGQSFRLANAEHLVQFSQKQTALFGEFTEENGSPYQIQMKVEERKRAFFLNQKPITSARLASHRPAVVFSPDSLNAIKGSDEERRTLIDQFVRFFAPSSLNQYRDYARALKTRNQILRNFKQGHVAEMLTLNLLEASDVRFLGLATEVTMARTQALLTLLEDYNFAMRHISSSFPEVGFKYLVSGQNAIHGTHREIHSSMRQRVDELRRSELASGHSLVGPQRHDIVFLFGGEDSRFYCSQGQQRSLILAFKLAQIVYHTRALKKTPILLLDDVLSELDGEKRSSFVDLVKTMKAQTVITTTDYDLPLVFREEHCSIQHVSNGLVTKKLKDVNEYGSDFERI